MSKDRNFVVLNIFLSYLSITLLCSALEESMPHLRKLLRRKEVIGTGARDTPALKLRWKFLLSNLVYAICSQSHPMVLLFEDLHWATDDALGWLCPFV